MRTRILAIIIAFALGCALVGCIQKVKREMKPEIADLIRSLLDKPQPHQYFGLLKSLYDKGDIAYGDTVWSTDLSKWFYVKDALCIGWGEGMEIRKSLKPVDPQVFQRAADIKMQKIMLAQALLRLERNGYNPRDYKKFDWVRLEYDSLKIVYSKDLNDSLRFNRNLGAK